MTTILAILQAKLDEGMGYTTYVFRNLEQDNWDTKYDMQYYRYTMSQFIKFIVKPKEVTTDFIM